MRYGSIPVVRKTGGMQVPYHYLMGSHAFAVCLYFVLTSEQFDMCMVSVSLVVKSSNISDSSHRFLTLFPLM